jgi:hypothetical protein
VAFTPHLDAIAELASDCGDQNSPPRRCFGHEPTVSCM